MPPRDERQPPDDLRRQFLESVMSRLDRFEADSSRGNDPLMRLTNKQIANSLLGVRMNSWDSELWNVADWSRASN